MYALTTASKFIESGSYKKVIVVGCDKMSSIIDYTDRTTCVLFGDGAGAALLEPNTEGYGIMDYILDNKELEKLVDTNDEWIVSRTGIKERRILKGVKGSSDLGAEAIKGLLKKTNTLSLIHI